MRHKSKRVKPTPVPVISSGGIVVQWWWHTRLIVCHSVLFTITYQAIVFISALWLPSSFIQNKWRGSHDGFDGPWICIDRLIGLPGQTGYFSSSTSNFAPWLVRRGRKNADKMQCIANSIRTQITTRRRMLLNIDSHFCGNPGIIDMVKYGQPIDWVEIEAKQMQRPHMKSIKKSTGEEREREKKVDTTIKSLSCLSIANPITE